MFKNMIISALLLVFSLNSFAFSVENFFAAKEKKKLGEVTYFYEDSSEVMELVQDLHKNFVLYVAKLTNFHTSYISETNFEDELKFASKLTVYSTLTFSKFLDGYRLQYSPIGNANTVFFDLGRKYNKEIELLFDNVQKYPSFVSLDNESNYGRGGTHLKAKSIPRPEKVSLICKNEIYYDGSGGDRCIIKTSKIDFLDESIEVFVHGPHGDTKVPKKYLDNWDKNYWNNKF